MAEKSKAAKVEPGEKHLTSEHQLADGNALIDHTEGKAEASIGGLFGDEKAPSMGELMGGVEDSSAEEKPAGEEKAEEKPAEEKKEEKPAEEKKEEKAESTVPRAALMEERRLRQSLQQDLLAIKRELKELKTKGPAKDSSASDEAEGTPLQEFTKKAKDLKKQFLDDPSGTMEKVLDMFTELPSVLSKKDDKKGDKGGEEDADGEVVAQIVNDGMQLIEELVPGISDRGDDGVNKKLTAFAHEHDFPKGFLPIITNPGTVVHYPGQKPRYLGDDAAYFVSYLNKVAGAKIKMTPEAEKKAREEITAAVTKELTEKITKELTEKFGKGKEQRRTITELPGESTQEDGSIFTGRRLSEAEYANLKPKDKAKYLGG